MRRFPSTNRLLGAMLLTGSLALTGCVSTTGPAPGVPQTSEAVGSSGDEDLLRLIRPSFIDEHDRVAVAVIEGDEVRTAFMGADESTTFEIGSITKVFTGERLAQAIERGEVNADDPVGQYLDLGDAPVASATLRDLAAHRSGLATFPSDPEFVERVTADYEAGRDPFDESLEEVLAAAGGMELAAPSTFSYSNMGATLVGHAVAAAAGTDYPALVSERLLDPLGLDGASLPLDDSAVPGGHAGGTDSEGDPVEPSTLAAYAPAGGIHATVGDLVTFAQAVLDGPLTDSAAQTGTIEVGDGSTIGYFWNVREQGGSRIVWHNGMTLGFASVMLIDTTNGTAAIVLANQSEPVDDVGATLLARLD
ncbi:serine hydrolase domain-containing protein [Agromyces sp. H66]|uniref:serine hydrolase domain-containing protein n=1 Tax=Agromyces sp. H66 TaxID=2529859 RepID=UPI00145A3241|nr:serine hydrolase domain-containing protein [Agromyces sp. H66]